jgi:hypothetical protein
LAAIFNHSDFRKLPTLRQAEDAEARRGGTPPSFQTRGLGESNLRSETICTSVVTKHTPYSPYFDIVKLWRNRRVYLTTAAFLWCCFPPSQPWLTPPPTSQTVRLDTRNSLRSLSIHLHRAQWLPYLLHLRAWYCDKPPTFRLLVFLRSNATSARRAQSERKFRMHIY